MCISIQITLVNVVQVNIDWVHYIRVRTKSEQKEYIYLYMWYTMSLNQLHAYIRTIVTIYPFQLIPFRDIEIKNIQHLSLVPFSLTAGVNTIHKTVWWNAFAVIIRVIIRIIVKW